jgi:hypothetical protein
MASVRAQEIGNGNDSQQCRSIYALFVSTADACDRVVVEARAVRRGFHGCFLLGLPATVWSWRANFGSVSSHNMNCGLALYLHDILAVVSTIWKLTFKLRLLNENSYNAKLAMFSAHLLQLYTSTSD